MKYLFFILSLSMILYTAALLAPADHLYAQGTGVPSCPPGRLCNPITSNTFQEVMQKVARTAALIGLPIVVLMIIWAGFLFVSARGNEEQLTKAKTTFFWAVIGALLVVGAFAIATAIDQFSKQL